jgi:beta-galactosidase
MLKLLTISASCVLVVSSFTAFSAAPALLERGTNFDLGWRFLKADSSGAEAPSFNDSSWRTVDLPHDWSIEDLPSAAANQSAAMPATNSPAPGGSRGRGRANFPVTGPFSPESPGGRATGFTLGGTGWYRKHFVLDKQTLDKRVAIRFDGVYMDSDMWLNGHHLGNHPYGYTAFAYDLTKFLNPPGQENVLAVRVRNEGRNSRWYSGSGICRHVVLEVTDPLRVEPWGVYVTTPQATKQKAAVNVVTSLHTACQAAGAVWKDLEDRRNQCSCRRRRSRGNTAGLRDQVAAPLVHRISGPLPGRRASSGRRQGSGRKRDDLWHSGNQILRG